MILWLGVFVLVIAVVAAGVIYMISRIQRFSWVDRLAKGRRRCRLALSGALLVLCMLVLTLLLGRINAVVCFIHFLIFWIICEGFLRLVQRLRKKHYIGRYTALAAVLVTTGYLCVGWVLANQVWQTNYTIHTDKAVGKLKLALFADSHVGTTFHAKGFAQQMDRIEKQKPDVVLIAGDFVDDDTSKEDMLACCERLGEMQTTYGVYYVFGNHDKGYYAQQRGYTGEELIEALERNGVTVLEDETVWIDERFYIIGRQDRSEEMEKGENRAKMNVLTEGLDKNCFSIVMDHQPGDYDAQAEAGVDLVVSGHTHGGQFFPVGIAMGALGIGGNDNIYGYEKRQNTSFIVTSGISDWAISFKTGCRSEYIIVDIEGKE